MLEVQQENYKGKSHLTQSIRKHDITVLPNYCILTFNRFTYDTTLKKKSKLHFKVALEEYIKIPY